MSSSKDYKNFILDQLSEVPNLTCWSMMGEFLFYSNGVLFGGIYDDCLLIKNTPAVARFNLPTALPYPGAKTPMLMIEDVDDKVSLTKMIKLTVEWLDKV